MKASQSFFFFLMKRTACCRADFGFGRAHVMFSNKGAPCANRLTCRWTRFQANLDKPGKNQLINLAVFFVGGTSFWLVSKVYKPAGRLKSILVGLAKVPGLPDLSLKSAELRCRLMPSCWTTPKRRFKLNCRDFWRRG